MNTLLLDVERWDLVTDSDGNIALAMDPYSTAQDVASAVRTFRGEVFYNTALGMPYLQPSPGATAILGQLPSAAFIKAQVAQQALTVPGVTNPVCYLSSLTARELSGQVLFTDANGGTVFAGF